MGHRAGEVSPFRSFGGAAATPVVAHLRDAQAVMTRVGFGRRHDGLYIEAPRRDAFYLIFQLCDHPPHQHWAEQRAVPAPISPKGSVHIADLNAAPSAVLDGRFDSLNLVMSRNFLDALADDCQAAPIAALRVPEPWQTADRVLDALAPVLLSTLEGAPSQLFVDHVMAAAATHVAETYGGMRRLTVRHGTLAPWQERRAMELIAANLSRDITLAQVAAECGLSLSYFSKAFRKSVGLTPHAWLQARRAERAKDLLAGGGMDFAQIALECGFADQSHFNRSFKRATGLPPGAWRRARLMS